MDCVSSYIVRWTEQLRIGLTDDNFSMIHLNPAQEKWQQDQKGNFTHGKIVYVKKCLCQDQKKAGNTRERVGFAPKIRHYFAIFLYFPTVHNLTYMCSTDKNTFQKKYSVKKCIEVIPFRDRNVVSEKSPIQRKESRRKLSI